MTLADENYRTPFPVHSLEWAAADFQPPPPPLPVLEEELASIASELIDAALDLERLVPLLKRITTAFDSNITQMAIFDFKRGVTLLHAFGSEMFGVDPIILRDYEDAAPIDARASFVVGFPGRAISTYDMDIEKQANLPVVAMAPPEFGQMMIVNEIDKPVWAFLSVLRHKDAPPYSQKEKARLAALSVWFGRAVQIFRAAEAARTASSEVSGVIMALSSPMALVNRDGKLVEINGAGDAVLGPQEGDIWEEPDGWHKALEVARKSGHGLHCDFIIGGRNQSLRLSRLPGSDELILVEFAIEAHHPIVAMDRFCGHYGLTRAERQVLGGLIEGAPISHLSQVLERGRETVKSQLRSIREKTGMKSQLAIVSSFQRFKDLTAA